MKTRAFTRHYIRQLTALLRSLVESLFPVLCLGCGIEGAQLCDCCFGEVVAGGGSLSFDSDLLNVRTVICSARYAGVPRLCVLAAKHDRSADSRMWTEVVGAHLAEQLWEEVDCRGVVYVVPAPSGLMRRCVGRYVAAELAHEVARSLVRIASQLGESCRVEVICALRLQIMRGSQAGRSVSQRNQRSDQINLVEGVLPNSARVVLVDDVVASGSTLKGCVNGLRRSGARVVAVLVACASAQCPTVEQKGFFLPAKRTTNL